MAYTMMLEHCLRASKKPFPRNYFTSPFILHSDFNIGEVGELMAMEDDDRGKLFKQLNFNPERVEEVAEVCNGIPVISEVKALSLTSSADGNAAESSDLVQQKRVTITSSDHNTLLLEIHRDIDEEELATQDFLCRSRLFPTPKPQQWWIIVADRAKGKALGIKKVTLNK